MLYKYWPFGKYKGFKISEIPTPYLVHALENWELSDELTFHIKNQIISNLDLIEFEDYDENNQDNGKFR